MADKQSKADALRAMREASYSAKSSDGGVGANTLTTAKGVRPARSQSQVSNRVDATPLRGDVATDNNHGSAGVALGPSEAKKKRAPRGTFDRTAYQRDYMRRRRASGKVDKYDRLAK
jgi:hypothetical protein